ncbi:MAG: hypothetical protein LUQ24_06715 [Methanobacterium sp.]|nr:hypothetical protein [Methanobacterium sp.]
MVINNKSIYIDKILIIIGFIFILLALIIIAVTPPASKYEISVYWACPIYFWWLIIASIILGIIVLLQNAFRSEKLTPGWFFLVFAMIILSNLIIILLPVLRGYYVTDIYDELGHLGMIQDIAVNGRIGQSNFYPIPHILTFIITSITDTNYLLTYKFIFPLFYIFYILGIFLLGREISNNSGIVFLIIAFAAPPIFTYFNYLFLPTQMCLYLLPMILFLLLKHLARTNISYSLLFFILLLVLPFLHPMGSLFIVGIFIILGISSSIFNWHQRRNEELSIARKIKWSTIASISMILFIAFFTWFSKFGDFNFYIQQITDSLSGSTGPSEINLILERQQQDNPFTIFQIARMVFLNYGQDILFALIASLACLWVLKQLFSKNESIEVGDIYFSLLFLVFSIFYAATLAANFTTTGRSIRIFCWALTAAIFLNGIVFFKFVNPFNMIFKNICIGLLVIILSFSTIFGVFNVFHSPLIRGANIQATEANIDGMQWLFINRDTNIDIASIDSLKYLSPPYLLYGYEASPYLLNELETIPDYFGYDQYDSMIETVNQDTYLAINQRDRDLIKFVPDYGNYSIANFDQIQNDPGVKRIYYNGDTEIMEVSSSANGQ